MTRTAYDNRLDLLTVKKGGSTLFSQDYVLLHDGQRDSVHETRGDGSTLDIDWDYDAIGRLIKEDYNSSDNSKDFVARYDFDLASNRVQKQQTGFQAATTTSVFNDRNELRDETTAGVTTHYDYDPNGSTLTKTTGTNTDSFAWDLRNWSRQL